MCHAINEPCYQCATHIAHQCRASMSRINVPRYQCATAVYSCKPRTSHKTRVGQDRIYTPYMDINLMISLPELPYIYRTYMVLANPTQDTCTHRNVRTHAHPHKTREHTAMYTHTHAHPHKTRVHTAMHTHSSTQDT